MTPKRCLRTLLLPLLISLFSVGFPDLAGAETGKKKSGRILVSDVDAADQGSVDLGVAEIEGKIFKPAVFFVLARSDFQYKGMEFRQTFLDRILIGALNQPF